MSTRVEWDRKHKVVLRLHEEHWPDPKTLGNTRLPDAEPEWVDLVEDYPPAYLPQFPQLMGNISEFYEDEDGTVHRTWPDADYSEEAVRSAAIGRVAQAADATMSTTDRIVLEALEHGDPIPSEVTGLRNRIRAQRENVAQGLVNAPIEQVIDNVPDFGDLARESAGLRLRHGWPEGVPVRPAPAHRPQEVPPPPDAEAD